MMIHFIEAYTIPESWVKLIDLCLKFGRVYRIDRGSNVGHRRKELDCITVLIKMPWQRPLTYHDDGIEYAPSTQEIYNYFYKFIVPEKIRIECYDYTYAERIASHDQLNKVIDMLAETPHTNQAVIRITQPSDIDLGAPPCMLFIQFKVIEGKLVAYTFFRSWDLLSGYPYNIPAIQLLKEYVLDEVNMIREKRGLNKFSDGELVAFSSGLHLYDYQWDIAHVIVQRTLYKSRKSNSK